MRVTGSFAISSGLTEQHDGTWEAWLEFDPIDRDGPTLRTDRETSQASREAVATWASGLEATYFQGAFGRAHVIPDR